MHTGICSISMSIDGSESGLIGIPLGWGLYGSEPECTGVRALGANSSWGRLGAWGRVVDGWSQCAKTDSTKSLPGRVNGLTTGVVDHSTPLLGANLFQT